MASLNDKAIYSVNELIKNMSEERENWSNGEWNSEPDFFDLSYKKYQCLAKRDQHLGTWEAYILLPKDSKYRVVDNHQELITHGLLIFHEDEDQNSSVTCDTIGFSCDVPTKDIYPVAMAIINVAHKLIYKEHVDKILNDMSVRLSNNIELPVKELVKGTYKNVAFVVKELKALVDQLV